jgi:hypothetical protein
MKRKFLLNDDSFHESLDKIEILQKELASLKSNFIFSDASSDNEKILSKAFISKKPPVPTEKTSKIDKKIKIDFDEISRSIFRNIR